MNIFWTADLANVQPALGETHCLVHTKRERDDGNGESRLGNFLSFIFIPDPPWDGNIYLHFPLNVAMFQPNVGK